MMWWMLISAWASPLTCEPGILEDWKQDSLACPDCMEPRLDALLAEQPTCAPAALARAALHHSKGEVQQAAEVLAAADHTDPRVVIAHAVAAHQAGQDTTELLTDALAANPRDPLLVRYQARTLPMAERAQYLTEADARLPYDEGLVADRIAALAQAGRPSAALQVGRASLETHPSPVVAQQVGELLALVPIEADEAFVHVADDGLEEVVVYSVASARRRLEAKLRAMGYDTSRRTENGVRFLPTRPMMPWVELRNNGTMEVQKRGVVERRVPVPGVMSLDKLGLNRTGMGLRLDPGIQANNTPLEQQGPQTPTLQLAVINVASRRKLSNNRNKVMGQLQPTVVAWRRALAEQTFSEAIEKRLPRALDDLWQRGVPLDGGNNLATYPARRAALLQFWSTRICSPEGERAREMALGFLRNVVASSAPLTPEEVKGAPEACGEALVDLL